MCYSVTIHVIHQKIWNWNYTCMILHALCLHGAMLTWPVLSTKSFVMKFFRNWMVGDLALHVRLVSTKA